MSSLKILHSHFKNLSIFRLKPEPRGGSISARQQPFGPVKNASCPQRIHNTVVYDMTRLHECLPVVYHGVLVPLCVYASEQLFCL